MHTQINIWVTTEEQKIPLHLCSAEKGSPMIGHGGGSFPPGPLTYRGALQDHVRIGQVPCSFNPC